MLERHLVQEFEVHSAATDDAAFALLDAYAYACVVVDIRAHSFTGIRLNAITTSVIAIVPPNAESVLPPNAVACVADENVTEQLVSLIRQICGRS